MHRRYAVSLPAFAVLILLLTLAAARCGSDKKDDDSAKKPAAVPATAGSTTDTAPAEWDGAQDWSASEWEVIEE